MKNGMKIDTKSKANEDETIKLKDKLKFCENSLKKATSQPGITLTAWYILLKFILLT